MGQILVQVISNIWYFLWIYVPGWLLTLVSRVLVWILSYQGFANETIINRGWTVTRDLSNLFFIIILLVIALGTILRSSRYGYQQNLRRLVLMAILINFSKTIALFFIEVSQAVTLAFVNAFLNSLQAGFPQLLGLTPALQLARSQGTVNAVGSLDILIQIVLGGIMMVVALIVIIIITLLFLYRIIAFGFIIILAPIAFLLSAWPTGFTYYQRWWKELGNYTAVGPALAFFLWLSFSVVQPGATSPGGITGCLSQTVSDSETSQVNSNGAISNFNNDANSQALLQQAQNDQSGTTVTAGGCGTPSGNPLVQTLIRFLVGISLLITGLTVAKELGVAGGGMANTWSGKIGGTLKGLAAGTAVSAGLGVASALRKGGQAIGWADQKTGGRLAAASNILKSRVDTATKPVRDIGQKALESEGGKLLSGVTKYATGAFAYDRLAQRAIPALRQRKTAETTAFTKQLGALTDDELVRKMDSINPQEARAAAMLLDKRGHFDVNPSLDDGTEQGKQRYDAEKANKQKIRNKADQIMRSAGPDDPVSDHYSGYQKKYLTGMNYEGLVKKIAGINTAGDFEKYAAHWDWTPELIQASQQAGVTDSQLQAASGKMTKSERKQFVTSIRSAIEKGFGDTKVEVDPVKKSDQIKKLDSLRALGSRVDEKESHRYAIDLEKTNGKLDIPESEIATAIDHDTLRTIVSKMKPEKLASLDESALSFMGQYMSKAQFAALGKASNVTMEQLKAAAYSAKLAGKKDMVDNMESYSDVGDPTDIFRTRYGAGIRSGSQPKSPIVPGFAGGLAANKKAAAGSVSGARSLEDSTTKEVDQTQQSSTSEETSPSKGRKNNITPTRTLG